MKRYIVAKLHIKYPNIKVGLVNYGIFIDFFRLKVSGGARNFPTG